MAQRGSEEQPQTQSRKRRFEKKTKSGKRCKNKDRDEYPNLMNRTSPLVLANAIEHMNETQKQQVRDIGFGQLLNLKIKDVPPKLSYWVLDNFNDKRCEIQLDGGRGIRVEEDDVKLMLGLPRGQIKIEKRVKNYTSKMTEEWRARFQKKHERILAKDICKDMLSQTEGGVWFKRQFIVLVTCCLVESIGNGYCSPQILDFLEDVDNVSQLDWCEYVVKCLIDHSVVWKKSKDKYFTGPTLFITLLYVDRVVVRYRIVTRSIPAFIEWNERLKERQEIEISCGGFGQGFIEGPFKEHGRVHVEQNNAELGQVNAEDPEDINELDMHPIINGEEHEDENDKYAIVRKIIEEGKIIRAAMSNIMELVKSVPNEMLANVVFRKTVKASLLLVGEPLCNISEDDIAFWGVDHLAAIAEMEEAAFKIFEIKRELDNSQTAEDAAATKKIGTQGAGDKVGQDEAEYSGKNDKSRLLRMDAAVDAMLPLGFSEAKVKEHVKELLEVYGGDEGWPFIEECAYKVLIDTILEERDDEEQAVQNGDPLEEKTCVDEEDGPPDMPPSDIKEPPGAAAVEPRRRHFPCYGWIESDEDDDDDAFMNLTPASTETEAMATSDVSKGMMKCKSRWDMRLDYLIKEEPDL